MNPTRNLGGEPPTPRETIHRKAWRPGTGQGALAEEAEVSPAKRRGAGSLWLPPRGQHEVLAVLALPVAPHAGRRPGLLRLQARGGRQRGWKL